MQYEVLADMGETYGDISKEIIGKCDEDSWEYADDSEEEEGWEYIDDDEDMNYKVLEKIPSVHSQEEVDIAVSENTEEGVETLQWWREEMFKAESSLLERMNRN